MKMNLTDRKQRLYVAQQGEKLRKGKISRRQFLRRAAAAGFFVSAAGMLPRTAFAAKPTPNKLRELYQQSDEVSNWLKEVGGRFSGSTIKISSESTPPSQITSELAKEFFTPLTGIEVQWEQV